MQATKRRRIVGVGLIGLATVGFGCAHSRPLYTYETHEAFNGPGVIVKTPYVDVRVPSKTEPKEPRDAETARRDK